ncbi:MAG: iron-containing alcohol dehydrogenase [Treponema sp.]|nr:iron-containing alcohol dehydrogenase [Treponema sp.]
MDISFKFDPEVHIGADALSMAGTIAARHGSRIMIAADNGLDSQTVNRLKEILEDSGLEAIVFDGVENDSAENIAELSRAAHCDAIIGIGGQKAQICARMAAIMAPMRITAFELMDGRIFRNKFLPFISIPTEGTYAFSFTEYFIAADPRNRMIKSIPSPGNLYSAIILDGSLFKFNPGNAAAAVFESLFTAAEAYCSSKANFLSDALLERALTLLIKLMKSTAQAGQPAFADTFAQASFLSSYASFLSSPGIGAALSAAINSRTPIERPICSAVLFPVIAQRLISARPEKMARLASLMGAPKAATVAETAKTAADTIRRNMEALKVPLNLKEHNISLDRLTAAAEAARNMDFVANSPWPVSEEDIFNILKEIF